MELHAEPLGATQFTEEWAYLGLQSSSGCEITFGVYNPYQGETVIKPCDRNPLEFTEVARPSTVMERSHMAPKKNFLQRNQIISANFSEYSERKSVLLK